MNKQKPKPAPRLSSSDSSVPQQKRMYLEVSLCTDSDVNTRGPREDSAWKSKPLNFSGDTAVPSQKQEKQKDVSSNQVSHRSVPSVLLNSLSFLRTVASVLLNN